MLEVIEAADDRCHLDECPDCWRRQTTLLTELVPDDHPVEDVLKQIAMLQARRGTLGLVVDHGPDGKIMIVVEFSIVLVVLVHVGGNVDEVETVGAANRYPLLVRFLCHLGDRGGHALGVEEEIALGGLDPARIHERRRAVHDRVDVVQSHLEEILAPHQALREDRLDLSAEGEFRLVAMTLGLRGWWLGPDGQALLDALDEDGVTRDADGVRRDVGFENGMAVDLLAGSKVEEVTDVDDECVVSQVELAQYLQDGVLAVRGHGGHEERGVSNGQIQITGGLDLVSSIDVVPLCIQPAIVLFDHRDCTTMVRVAVQHDRFPTAGQVRCKGTSTGACADDGDR